MNNYNKHGHTGSALCLYCGGTEQPPTVNNSNLHPIDLALAVTLSSIDSLLWIINELLGLHTPQPTPAAPTTAAEPVQVTYIRSLTKRQLQVHTGLKSSRYNKAQLLDIALLRL